VRIRVGSIVEESTIITRALPVRIDKMVSHVRILGIRINERGVFAGVSGRSNDVISTKKSSSASCK